jgi:N-formylglutamate deformylase
MAVRYDAMEGPVSVFQFGVTMHKPFFVSIPHSGEKVPMEADWLMDLAEPILMCDVDRYVDRLYMPTLEQLEVPSVICAWHRYAVDLNRFATDVDQNSVQGSKNAPGTFNTGLHWVKTTTGHTLMHKPIDAELHQAIVTKYFEPFHASVRAAYETYRQQGFAKIFHIDAHSMPSMGTAAHRDPGQKRAEIVISDQDGKSCEPQFRDLVVEAYTAAGFQVAVNWPYKGGRLTEAYGVPSQGQHVVQVELNRALYMDETTKKLKAEGFTATKTRIEKAVRYIVDQL